MSLSPRRSGRRAPPPARFVNHDDKDHANLKPYNSAGDGKLPPLPLSALLGSTGVIPPHLPTPHSIEKQASTVSSCTTAEAFSSSSSCDSETEGEEDDEEAEEVGTSKEGDSKKRKNCTEEKKLLDLGLFPPADGAAGGAGTLDGAAGGAGTLDTATTPGHDETNHLSSLFIAARTGDTAILHDLLYSSSSPLSSLPPAASSSILDTPHPSTGESALEVAAEEGQAPIVTLLLQGGADPMRKNKQTGGTPMGKAFSGLHLECYRILEAALQEPLRPYLLCKARGLNNATVALARVTAGGTGLAPNSREEKRKRCADALPAWLRGRAGRGEGLPVVLVKPAAAAAAAAAVAAAAGGIDGGGVVKETEGMAKKKMKWTTTEEEGGREEGMVREELLRAVCAYIISPSAHEPEEEGKEGERGQAPLSLQQQQQPPPQPLSRRLSERRPRRPSVFARLASEGECKAEEGREEGKGGGMVMSEGVFDELMLYLAPVWDPARREGGREGGKEGGGK
ncbi:Hypothetical protein NocV09_00800190 [Nannochloropsis oceanica]